MDTTSRNNSRLFQFLKEEKMTDCTLTAEGKQIKAHKLILASASGYFERLFIALGQQHPVIVLKDVSVRQLSLILEYVYLGQCDLEPSDVKEFKKVAESMEIKVELNVPSGAIEVTSSSPKEDEELSYDEMMDSGSRRSFGSDRSEPPTKKIKQEKLNSKTPPTPSNSVRGTCPHCSRDMRLRDIAYHSRHCWNNDNRIESNCSVCKRPFEYPVHCKSHEKKDHGLHQISA